MQELAIWKSMAKGPQKHLLATRGHLACGICRHAAIHLCEGHLESCGLAIWWCFESFAIFKRATIVPESRDLLLAGDAIALWPA